MRSLNKTVFNSQSNRLTTLTLFFLFAFNGFSISAQSFDWVKSFGGSGWDQGKSINVDINGNIYTTGKFQRTADFDPSPNVAYNIDASTSDGNIFFQKTDSNGNFIWAKSIDGNGYSEVLSTLDNYGNIYSTGSFSGTIDINPGLNTVTYSTVDIFNFDVFISKLNSNGAFVWAKHLGGQGHNSGKCITTDLNNNVFVAGTFQDTLRFETDPSIPNLISSGHTDIFVSKLSPSGNILWAKKIGGLSLDKVESIETDANGNVLFTGSYRDTVDFDAGPGVHNLTTERDVETSYICKYDNSGNFIWVKKFDVSTYGFSNGKSIAVDQDSNIYSTGLFYGTVDFDPSSNIFQLTYDNNSEVYISKLDSDGNFIWAKHINVKIETKPLKLKLDNDSNILLTSSFYGAYDFDPSSNSIFALNSPDGFNIFICKLNTHGDFIRAQQIGGIYNEQVNDLFIDNNNDVYLTGYFDGDTDFDPSYTNTYYVNGRTNIFILKLNQNNSSGIDQTKYKNITVYPSVVNNIFTVKSYLDINQLEIFNISGQKMLHITPNICIKKVNISNYHKGIYIVKITTKNSTRIARIIKK